MTAHSATRMLQGEHLVIAKVVGAAPMLADRLEAGQTVDVETLNGVVEFMRTFADKCHHGKEEDLLFPLLGKKGVPMQGCPVAMLTMEHGKGRVLVKSLVEAAQAYQQGRPGASQAVGQALRGIASLYPNHIWKEDYMLFPLTDKILSSDEQKPFTSSSSSWRTEWAAIYISAWSSSPSGFPRAPKRAKQFTLV